MKNVVFWDIKTQFVPHRRHITFPLEGPAVASSNVLLISLNVEDNYVRIIVTAE
jgi:hypothetical protein